MSKKTITLLIVDDDEDIATMMKLLLENKIDGICVQSAETVQEAEALQKKHDFNVMMVDGHLRTENTIAFVQQTRASGHKCFMLSISNDSELAEELVEAGCDVKAEKGLMAVEVVVKHFAA